MEEREIFSDFGVWEGDCGVSHQAHPQRSNSWSEAKWTYDTGAEARGEDILFVILRRLIRVAQIYGSLPYVI